jgi:K+-transporting ATPase A subunit
MWALFMQKNTGNPWIDMSRAEVVAFVLLDIAITVAIVLLIL